MELNEKEKINSFLSETKKEEELLKKNNINTNVTVEPAKIDILNPISNEYKPITNNYYNFTLPSLNVTCKCNNSS